MLVAAPGRKVDQSLVRILDERPRPWIAFTQRASAFSSSATCSSRLGRGAGVEPPPFPATWAASAGAPERAAASAAAVLDQLLDERPDLLEQRVRLLEREDAFRHMAMIENDVTAGQRLELADYDAVTLDAYGTLLELEDPVGALAEIVPGFARADVERAFLAEAAYYAAHAHEGRDRATLAKLSRLHRRVQQRARVPGLARGVHGHAPLRVPARCARGGRRLRRRGLELAVVSNWDVELREHLAPLDVLVVTSADVGVAADPASLRLATERLGVAGTNAAHRRCRRGSGERRRGEHVVRARTARAGDGAVAIDAARSPGRLYAWLWFVGIFAALAYSGRFAGGVEDAEPLYEWTTGVAGLVQFAVVRGSSS